MTFFEGNLPQKRQSEREREREKEKREIRNERRRTGKRAGEQATTGCISLIGFACSVNVHNSIWLVKAKFHRLRCTVAGYRFWGEPIALQCFEHFDRDIYIIYRYNFKSISIPKCSMNGISTLPVPTFGSFWV